MIGLFPERSPCRITNDSKFFTLNLYSWNNYIDQPVGVGFSIITVTTVFSHPSQGTTTSTLTLQGGPSSHLIEEIPKRRGPTIGVHEHSDKSIHFRGPHHPQRPLVFHPSTSGNHLPAVASARACIPVFFANSARSFPSVDVCSWCLRLLPLCPGISERKLECSAAALGYPLITCAVSTSKSSKISYARCSMEKVGGIGTEEEEPWSLCSNKMIGKDWRETWEGPRDQRAMFVSMESESIC